MKKNSSLIKKKKKNPNGVASVLLAAFQIFLIES